MSFRDLAKMIAAGDIKVLEIQPTVYIERPEGRFRCTNIKDTDPVSADTNGSTDDWIMFDGWWWEPAPKE